MAMEASNAYKVPEEKLMTCASNFECHMLDMEAYSTERVIAPLQTEEMEINITDCTDSGEKGIVERGYRDETESSSSFGDTDSGIEYDAVSGDCEVESRWQEDGTSMISSDGLGDLFRMRKKKLTTHWRKFISPLMWRCKWLELHIKELQTQASNYDKELSIGEQRKRHELQRFTTEDLHVKSTPKVCQSQGINVMRRKRRKRVEETVDVSSYMAEHNLFSYYVNKRSFADDGYMNDGCSPSAAPPNNTRRNDEFGANGEWLPLEFKDGCSLEDTLQKIGELQSQVQRLSVRVRKVLDENPAELASSDNLKLLAPCDAVMCSTAHLGFHSIHGEVKGESYTTTLFPTTKKKASDQVMPESAVSSYGEVVAPLAIDQSLVGITPKKIEDGILVYRRSSKREHHGSEGLGLGKRQSLSTTDDQQAGSAQPLPGPKSESPSETTVTVKRSTLKPRSKLRKRRKGKAASSRWNRKSQL